MLLSKPVYSSFQRCDSKVHSLSLQSKSVTDTSDTLPLIYQLYITELVKYCLIEIHHQIFLNSRQSTQVIQANEFKRIVSAKIDRVRVLCFFLAEKGSLCVG